jgi:hypothetical protein
MKRAGLLHPGPAGRVVRPELRQKAFALLTPPWVSLLLAVRLQRKAPLASDPFFLSLLSHLAQDLLKGVSNIL